MPTTDKINNGKEHAAPAIIDLTDGALGLPATGGEREWAEQNFLPLQRELGAWLRAGVFPHDLALMPSLFPQGEVIAGKTASVNTGDAPIWFIGDLHGDFLALLLALNLAHTYDHTLAAHQGGLPPGAASNLFFLGDFIDEGPHSAEIMAWLLASCAGQTFGGQRFAIMALAGNHDVALAYDEAMRGFWSSVMPSDFAVRLNASPHPLAVDFGKAICAFYRELPRMALLNDGIMAVHGGVPRPELTAAIRNAGDVQSAAALDDYLWGRLLEDEPEGNQDQFRSGTVIGYREFDRFIEVFARVNGSEPKLLLRGHDHKPRNYKWLEHYQNCRVLTLNGFTVNRRGPAGGAYYRPVTLARVNRPQSDPLDIHIFQFDLSPSLIDYCHGLPSLLDRSYRDIEKSII